jgi:uncharacterized protein YndB with AHSA1/START domain
MSATRREILSQVAAGTMTPAEAASRLDEVEREQAHPSGTQSASSANPIEGVRVNNSFGRVVVLGDASVDQAAAEGPHVARRENGILVIESEQSSDDDFRFGSRGGWWKAFGGQTLTVRMNPRLELWINADAGSVTVRDIKAPIHAEVHAGSLVIQGFAGPIDLATSAGSIRGEGSLKEGKSRIRCEMGSVRISLTPDSDVTISATTQMGKVNLDGSTETRGRTRWTQHQEAVRGRGTASLDIEAQMGSVVVGPAG